MVEEQQLLGASFIGPQHYFKVGDVIWVEARGAQYKNIFFQCQVLSIRKNLTTPEKPLDFVEFPLNSKAKIQHI